MGKRIIQRVRGHGGPRYRVRRKAFSVKPAYGNFADGMEFEIVKLFSSAGHTSPIAKMKNKEGKVFYNIAARGLFEGQKIKINRESNGDISEIGKLKNGTKVFNIESKAKDGGKFIRTGGNSAVIARHEKGEVVVMMPSKQEKRFNVKCRATIGEISGQGRLDKPILKAGKKFYIKKAKAKLWPRTSAVKMNIIDHPFGSGRGKRPKPKIVKRMAAPGQKVGLLRPRRTGRKKR